ncbi:agmatinase family protein [Fulvivirgaceae bacterium BMA12]|uniref:Agmatinase family protein n=1 Tax=Agaribacillus aureus TaxID=3051825 RepID=A0ABT8L8P7_9BACT|nr:agmatinase family protein [Fulvivirgaceae bacterium BMA12]
MINKDAEVSFDPNSVGVGGKLFGLPFTEEDAQLVIIPVPWEVTVSYMSGTARGPEAVLEASPQLDLALENIHNAWELGIFMQPISEEWKEENEQWRKHTLPYIKWLESGKKKTNNATIENTPEAVNTVCRKLNHWVKSQSEELLNKGKMVGILGGDHSTPFGLIEALAERYQDFGVLQFDAHADLRDAYEGFEFSHASVMYNVSKLNNVSKIVQVGIRDFSQFEHEFIENSKGKINTYFYPSIKKRLFSGEHWKDICQEIIGNLPENVYVSFDIDGLDPKLCPNTGTPVPGGFEFDETIYLIDTLVKSGKKIIGFDVCEVAPGKNNQWDGNVGARILYNIANLMAVSQGKLQMIQ